MENREKTTEQLEEDLRKTREELAIQKWGNEKTLEGMKVLVKELIQKGKEVEKFKLAVDNVSDQIILTDPEATVLYINNATEKITGYVAKEVVGEKAGKLWGNLMDKAFYENLWKTIKIDKKTFIGEILNQRKNKQTYNAYISISPILDEKGEIEFFVGIEHDITKEKEIEKVRADFLALASHQLRTPLSGTKWLIETLERQILGPVTPKQKEYLDRIYLSNERMIKLVFDMLNVLRLESGTADIKKEAVVVADLYRELTVAMEPAAKARGVILRNDLKNHKAAAVKTDVTLLRSIMECFISNAINYSNAGQAVIIDIKDEPGAAVFFVKDSGIGIPQDEQARIFERFYRAANAKNLKPDGTGLGLYMATMLAEKVGGKVSFESQEGQGSTFYLRISK